MIVGVGWLQRWIPNRVPPGSIPGTSTPPIHPMIGVDAPSWM